MTSCLADRIKLCNTLQRQCAAVMMCRLVMIKPVQILSFCAFLIAKRTNQGMAKSARWPLMIRRSAEVLVSSSFVSLTTNLNF